jgi:signal transduction histidine kinase
MRPVMWYDSIVRWTTKRPWRMALLRYLICGAVVVLTATLLPYDSLGDSRGVAPFLVLVGCAWCAGLGPGLMSLLVLIFTFHYRTNGYPGCLNFTRAQLTMMLVLSVVIGAVGRAGTLRRRAHELTRRRESELQELHRRKDAFLAILAHELRNPMAPLRSGLEILRLSAEHPAAKVDAADVRKMMQRQVDHLVRLIDDLLEVSRINTGKIELRRASVELNQVIRNAVETSQPNITAANHELIVKTPEASLVLDVDPARMAQVIMNLLNNAAKFTPPGGRIELTASVEKGVRISVRDNGVGISPEMLPRLFELFMQAPDLLNRGHGGLGIGLGLARALVELHGGRIAVSSEGPGKGSEFVVTLPETAMTHPAGAGRLDGTGLHRPLDGGRRILIVDDNVDAAQSLAMLLSTEGHQCQPVNDGETALSVAAHFKPDVFLLDIGMPGMSGYELSRRLRALPQFRSSLVIAVTGWGKDEDRRQSSEAGFDHHLTKPVSTSELRELLKKVDMSAA